jgi:hypothetical protein
MRGKVFFGTIFLILTFSWSLAQIRGTPLQGVSATCYRHEPIKRVLCQVEVPPGGSLSLDKGNTFAIAQKATPAQRFYVDHPLAKESRSFEKIVLQQRARPQTFWVEFSLDSSVQNIATLKLGPLEAKNIPLNLVLPLSYKAPKGDIGDYQYLDETGLQLIDGERGIAPYTASKNGNPPSYEWVGWERKKVTLQFTLPSWTAETPLKKVLVGTFRGFGGIEIPKRIVIWDNRSAGSAFEVDAGVFKPETPVFLELQGEFYGPNLVIELEPGGDWIFVDEVRFSLE